MSASAGGGFLLSQPRSVVSAATPGHSGSQAKSQCPYFRRGKCRWEDRCRFSHVDNPEEDPRGDTRDQGKEHLQHAAIEIHGEERGLDMQSAKPSNKEAGKPSLNEAKQSRGIRKEISRKQTNASKNKINAEAADNGRSSANISDSNSLELKPTSGLLAPQSEVDISAVSSLPPEPLRGICWDWRNGKCQRGNHCRYRHTSQPYIVANHAQEPRNFKGLVGSAKGKEPEKTNGKERRKETFGDEDAAVHQDEKAAARVEGDAPQFSEHSSKSPEVVHGFDSSASQNDPAKYGVGSNFDRAEDDKTQASEGETTGAPQSFPTRAAICRDWKLGRCRRGSVCPYRHEVELSKLQAKGGNQENGKVNRYMRGIQKNEPQALERAAEEKREIEREEPSEQAKALLEFQEQQRQERVASQEAQRKAIEEDIRVQEEKRKEDETRKQEELKVQVERRRQEEKRKHERRKAEMERRQDRLREEKRKAEIERRRQEERRREEEHRAELARQREEARKERERIAKEEREARWKEEAVVVEQYLVLDSSLITCAAGLAIQHVVTGFDLCRITIKNLPRNAEKNEIEDLFVQQGVPTAEFFLSQVREFEGKVEAMILANAEKGQAIALGLEGIEFRDEVLTFEVSDNASWNAMGSNAQAASPFLTVNWKVPSETIIATYSSAEDAARHARRLDGKIWNSQRIKASVDNHPRGNAYSIKILHCPKDTGYDVNFLDFIETFGCRVLKAAPYDHHFTLLTIREHLSRQGGVRMETYQVISSKETAGENRVKVCFNDWEDVKRAHASVDNQRLGPLGYGLSTPFLHGWYPRPLQYTIRIPQVQYHAQKKQWDTLSEKKPGSDAHVHTRHGDRGDIVFIHVLGDDKKAAGALKVRVESLVSGETLGPDYWHPSFLWLRETRPLFDRIRAATGAHVSSDFKTRSLRVYGSPEVMGEARRLIEVEVERRAGLETSRVIDRAAIGYFVRVGLGRLKELLGEENANLNLGRGQPRIVIKGGEEARHHLQRVIDESRQTAVRAVDPDAGEDDACPVCYTAPSNPEQLGCGHTYCAGCLNHLLSSAAESKNFPVVCMGGEATCNIPISIPFMRHFMPTQAFQHLVEVAFNCYLEQRPQELKYCTTPDCKQIYRRQSDKSILQCPSCFSTICPACDEEAHEGMTCAQRRLHRDPAEQERLNDELAAEQGYKKCPRCRIWIEKTEGCNHMSCKCGAHICWVCLAVFDSGAETYGHMNQVHNGIYNAVPAGIVDANVPFNVAEQVDALARIERLRAARDEERRQQAEAARMRQQIEEARVRQLTEARMRQQVEEARMREARRLQQNAEAARRAELQQRVSHPATYRPVEYLHTPPKKKEEEGGGWCIVM